MCLPDTLSELKVLCEHSMSLGTEDLQILKTLGSLDETPNLSLMNMTRARRSEYTGHVVNGPMTQGDLADSMTQLDSNDPTRPNGLHVVDPVDPSQV